MRWHTAALLLASLVSTNFAKEEPLSHTMTSCKKLHNVGPRNFRMLINLFGYYEYTITQEEMNDSSMELMWGGELEHAAGALFRAKCIATGFRPESLKLQWYPRNKHAPVTSLDTMMVQVTLRLKIYVRLTSRAAASPACYDVESFITDNKIIRKCDFLLPGEDMAVVYFPINWLRDTMYLSIYPNYWKIEYIERSDLMHFVRESNHSFIFLDADPWNNFTGVRITQFSNKFLNDTVWMIYDKNLPVTNPFEDLITNFSPSLNVLRNVIEFTMQNHSTMEESACDWFLQNSFIKTSGIDRPTNYTNEFYIENRRGKILIIVCEREKKDFDEYLYLIETMRVSNEKPIRLYSTDCQNTKWLLNTLLFWFQKKLNYYTTGIILTNDMATVVENIAEIIKLPPILTYDMSIGTNETWSRSAVRSATGRVAHFELSLRRLLADCGWRRLGIVSESTRLATELSTALRAPAAGLTVREVNVTSAPEIRSALQELLAAEARVFLVNTNAAAAAVVLATAQELNITRDAGFVWIVREYSEADKATAATRPLSVSFRWRGDVADEACNSTLLTKLETRWRGRAWPLHAAPLADAILTLQKVKQIKNDNFNPNEAVKTLWAIVHRSTIFGIKQNLLYDEQGVANSIVYVEQWGAAPRPRILTEWHSNQWRESAQCPMADPPPSDGFVRCVIPRGDPFQPTCRDTIWFLSIISATLVSALLIFLTIRYSRQALAARDQRVKTELAKRMLARRERVFAALAAYLVDRTALELHQELGTGRFGVVRLGVLHDQARTRRAIVVAAKGLRDDASPAEESEFLREACTLAALDHEHVVRFIGVCVVDGPPLLLMEHASFSDLLRYLQSRRYLVSCATSVDIKCPEFGFEEKAFVSAEAITRLAREAAAALTYISERGIVHRDVRASNYLVDEKRSLKLADFGLARATGTIDGEYACRRHGMFPVLWMAPESLASGVFSSASDVWSFGVLVFELVTLGRRPYGSQPPASVLRHVVGGGQPQLPWDASAETQSLVRACWRRTSEARPTAAQLGEWLKARRRALRPALATELVEVDSEVNGNNKFNERDLNVCTVSI